MAKKALVVKKTVKNNEVQDDERFELGHEAGWQDCENYYETLGSEDLPEFLHECPNLYQMGFLQGLKTAENTFKAMSQMNEAAHAQRISEKEASLKEEIQKVKEENKYTESKEPEVLGIVKYEFPGIFKFFLISLSTFILIKLFYFLYYGGDSLIHNFNHGVICLGNISL